MFTPTVFQLTVLPGIVHSFSGGCIPFSHTSRQHRQHVSAALGDWSRPTASLAGETRSAGSRPAAAAAPPRRRARVLRLMPNEYEAFFNKASKMGADATRGLAPEERAQRAMEGEKLEDEIIEIATVLREKADEMVAQTGAINFEIIQPMIDEIAVLKSKYKVVMGASEAVDGSNGGTTSDGDSSTNADEAGSR
ncbi:unnamed protein product [Scytosiphon promiscuus]